LTLIFGEVELPIEQRGVANLSAAIDIQALRAYRLAVGRGTREVVKQLEPEALKRKVDSLRLWQVMDEGAVGKRRPRHGTRSGTGVDGSRTHRCPLLAATHRF
jgi:hypothetical protein